MTSPQNLSQFVGDESEKKLLKIWLGWLNSQPDCSQNFQKIGENTGKYGKVVLREVKKIVTKETPRWFIYNGL